MTAVTVRPVHGPAEMDAELALRARVFCEEQGVSVDAERDGRDPDALHLVAVAGERVVGTCRLVIDAGGAAHLGRMAVERSHRRRGVGRAVLLEAERRAREAGARRAALHAQLTAGMLYELQGYAPRGRPFVEEGLDHVAMEKALA